MSCLGILVALAGLFLVALDFLPQAQRRSDKFLCANNLRQLGLAVVLDGLRVRGLLAAQRLLPLELIRDPLKELLA